MIFHDDYGRNNLVTTFHCSECGNQLTLSYKNAHQIKSESDGITGSDKVQYKITIYPCDRCIKTWRRPAELLKELTSCMEALQEGQVNGN